MRLAFLLSLSLLLSPLAGASPKKGSRHACDTSKHKVRFITVAPGVQLEVLDWGGKGEPLVLLTGLGDNAHVFDDFAYQFIDRFHVIGITRRGFGRSSQTKEGYDIATRARDDIAVLDALGIRKAIFMGHSIAGTELNKLGADYPQRVKKLVYLDALDLGSGGWAKLPQPPPSPELSDADLRSVQALAAADARDDGFRKPLAALSNSVRTSPSGRIIGAVTPPEISTKMVEGLESAHYSRIKAPTLAIFNQVSPQFRAPYYEELSPAQQQEYRNCIRPLSRWISNAIQRFRSGMKHARVIELQDANHYFFIVNEAMVVREVRKFLLEDQAP